MTDPDSLKAVAKKGKTRRWSRRWAKMCDDCGTPILFMDNSQPPAPGQKWSPFVAIEIYGERDGVLMPWNGEISYDPRLHVKHTDCPRIRRRLGWIIRNKAEYDL